MPISPLSEAKACIALNNERSSHDRCWWLAMTGVVSAMTITALTLSGWRIGGNSVDWFPSLVALMTSYAFAALVGRLQGSTLSMVTAVSMVLGWAAGHSLLVALGRSEVAGLSSATIGFYAAALLVAAFANRLSDRFLDHTVEHPGDRGTSQSKQKLSSIFDEHRGVSAVLLAWGIIVAGCFWVGGQTDRTGFRMITVPYDHEVQSISILGFSVLQHGRPIMAETVPAVEQATWFSGVVRSDDNFRFLRAGYAFIASQFCVFTGSRTSLLIVNGLAWLGCLAIVAAMSAKYGGRWAVLASVSVAAVGIGFGVHINDTTPHTLAFFLYFLGVWLIETLGFVGESKPWRSHLMFALIVGSSSLAYNVAQMLLFVYLVVGIRHQRLLYLGSASFILLSFRPIWRWILPGLGINVRDVEGEYLARSIAFWKDSFAEGFGSLIRDASDYTFESFSAMESPWLITLAVMSLLATLKSKRNRLLIAAVVAPVLACTLFAPTSYSRGYIVFSGSISLYLWIGIGFAALFNQPWVSRVSLFRFAVLSLLGVFMFGGLFWTTSHYRGWLGPAKLFYFGYKHSWPLLISPSPIFVDASGDRPVSSLFGGEGRFADLAIPDAIKRDHPPYKNLGLTLLSRFPFFASLGLIIAVATETVRRRRLWLGGLTVWLLLSTLVLFTKSEDAPSYVDLSGAIAILPGESFVYEILASDKAIEALSKSESTSIDVYAGSSDPVELTFSAGGVDVRTERIDDAVWRISNPERLLELDADSKLRFELFNKGPSKVYLNAWQVSDGRTRRLTNPMSSFLPSLEVRIRDSSNGAMKTLIY